MNRNITLVIIALILLMESVDTTVINTAIPSMAHSLNVDPIDLKIALISYLISLAVFIPISGWIGDKFGVKRVFISAIAIFTLSSIWCGFTNSLQGLVMARIAQGLGGSLALPLGRLIIARTFERHELIAKMSFVVMVASIGMMLGPVIGGVITSYFAWNWIFWINVPVGLIAFFLSFKVLPDMPAIPVHKLDKWGFLLFGSGLATLTFGLSLLSESNTWPSSGLMIIAIALLLLGFYSKHSYHKPDVIVNISLLQSRTFRVSVMGNLCARLGFGGIPFLVPLLLQLGLGFSPELAGFLLAPIALGVLFFKPCTLSVIRFLGYKKLLLVNTLLVGLSLMSFVLINNTTPLYWIGLLTFIYGGLISMQYTGMSSLAYANLESQEISAATSIMSTVQQLAQSFGVAFAAILVRCFATQTLSIAVFHQVFVVMGLVTFCSMIIFIQLKHDDGAAMLEVH